MARDPEDISFAELPAALREEAMHRFAVLRPHLEENVSLAATAKHADVPLRTPPPGDWCFTSSPPSRSSSGNGFPSAPKRGWRLPVSGAVLVAAPLPCRRFSALRPGACATMRAGRCQTSQSCLMSASKLSGGHSGCQLEKCMARHACVQDRNDIVITL